MPRVFTLFFHGTDFHRDKDANEVVTLLHNAVAGAEAALHEKKATAQNPLGYRLDDPQATHLVLEGPGAGTVGEDDSSSGRAHGHPGQVNPIFGTKKTPLHNPAVKKVWVTPEATITRPMPVPRVEVAEEVSDTRADFIGNTADTGQTRGRLFGTGWEDSVYRATWLLTHLQFERDAQITKVNMVGWSRGAVTCFMAANKLYEVFGNTLELNIFAIDPVPGGMTGRTPAMTHLPPTVRNLFVVLALDDDRSTFQPLDSDEVLVHCPATGTAPALKAHFLPLPGNHSDVVFPTKGNARKSGQICLHLAHKFLTHHGTRFKAPPPGASMSVADLVAAYAELREGMETIKTNAAMKNTVGERMVGLVRTERSVRQKRGEYVSDPWRWVNEHHRQCVLAPNLTDAGAPPLNVRPGLPYSPWQGFLPHLGIIYDGHRVATDLVRG